MHAYFRGVLVAGIAARSGCGFALRPVVMNATAADWAALDGEWRGEYTMDGHDRRGLITFRPQAETRQAAGGRAHGARPVRGAVWSDADERSCEDGVRTLKGRWRVTRPERSGR